MKSPLVSICIPNYNCGKFIGKTIESVMSQTYKNVEIIIVDNASTDNSWKIISSFRHVKKYRHKTNMGYNENLNRCIELSKGIYIKILHADDILEKDAIEKQVGIMEKNPTVGMVHSAVAFIDEYGNESGRFVISENFNVKKGDEKLTELLEGNHVMFPSVFVRKECFEDVGIFDGEIPYCNDWDMWMRICMKYDVAYMPDVTAYYRIYDESGGTKRYETSDISGFQQFRCLTKILTMINDDKILKMKMRFYRNLAREQVAKGLKLISKGKKSHGRRYIMASATFYDSMGFRLSVYAVLIFTYLGLSGFMLKIGNKISF